MQVRSLRMIEGPVCELHDCGRHGTCHPTLPRNLARPVEDPLVVIGPPGKTKGAVRLVLASRCRRSNDGILRSVLRTIGGISRMTNTALIWKSRRNRRTWMVLCARVSAHNHHPDLISQIAA